MGHAARANPRHALTQTPEGRRFLADEGTRIRLEAIAAEVRDEAQLERLVAKVPVMQQAGVRQRLLALVSWRTKEE